MKPYERNLDEIRFYQKTNVAKTVERILNTLKLMCQCEMPPIREDRIHFHNGTYHLAGDFSEEKMDNEPASCQI